MCRLLGFISEKPAPLGYYMLHAPVPFRSFGDKRNPDGWGLGWYECDVPMFFKELRPAPFSRLLPLVTAGTVTNLAIAHVRKASQGNLCRLNCHDFTSANFLLADGRHLYAYRNATQRTRHFSLFYRSVERSRRPPCAAAAALPHDVRDVAHVVVCSNRLTPGRWRSVPLRHLLKVERGAPPELMKLHA